MEVWQAAFDKLAFEQINISSLTSWFKKISLEIIAQNSWGPTKFNLNWIFDNDIFLSKYHLFLDTPTKENVDIPDIGNNYEEDKGCFQRDLFATKKRETFGAA